MHFVLTVMPRSEEEDVQLNEEALALLTQIGVETSLRYAINLISASNLIMKQRNPQACEVASEDVSKAYSLFIDVNRSVQYLKEFEEHMMYGDDNDGSARFAGDVEMR